MTRKHNSGKLLPCYFLDTLFNCLCFKYNKKVCINWTSTRHQCM